MFQRHRNAKKCLKDLVKCFRDKEDLPRLVCLHRTSAVPDAGVKLSPNSFYELL